MKTFPATASPKQAETSTETKKNYFVVHVIGAC